MTPRTQENEKDEKEGTLELVHDAPPPTMAVAAMVLIGAIAIRAFPPMSSVDEVAKPEVFTNRLFPSIISLPALLYIRTCFAILCLAATCFKLFFSPGGQVDPAYLPQSKLQRNWIRVKGIRQTYPFTSWSWNVLGMYFALSAYGGWTVATTSLSTSSSSSSSTMVTLHHTDWLFRITLILWEIAAPCALLVSAVVTYAIWPATLKRLGTPGVLTTPTSLLQHNGNIIMVFMEVALLGGLPVHMRHISLPILFGVTYIFFTWAIRNVWNPKGGSAFLYFFLDTTLGAKTTTMALFALLAALVLFYCIFSGIEHVLQHEVVSRFGLLGHVAIVVLLCATVCKVRA